ncbi:type 4b pilus protein PilO2 [Candidimonas humi]|uniref:Type 4b pilus protein PilO2 n=1 Tax=Candidimonas humi TaxID=683355 RepID=A0ABV8NR09_9BURK|nr:type 4b pilus protein PilO2 [Candidimonas humi]MBV6303810.1 type 4b pilus protein PilO2 [Candidimonas humi]
MDGVLIIPGASVSLAFGLEWQPLIPGRAVSEAQRRARRVKATHVVVAGDGAAAAGMARLSARAATGPRPIHSAAQGLALLFGVGTFALLLELAPRRHWLVAVHDGAVVMRTDRLFESSEDAAHILAELRQAYPRLAVLPGAAGYEAPGLAQIEAAATVQTRLVPVAARWQRLLPRRLQWLVLAALLAMLLPRAWQALRPSRPAQAAAGVDAEQAWRAALRKAQRKHVLHGVAGTRSVLAEFYALPVSLAGWRLSHAACEARPGAWLCTARYERRDAHASNAGLLAAAPRHWRLDFPSMEQAGVHWQLAYRGLPLDEHVLSSHAHNERHLISALQAILPAFASLRLGKGRKLEAAAPRDAQGRPLPRPASLPAYMLRSVEIHGPLRSASLLLPYTQAMAWRKVSLSLRDAARPALKSSSLHLSLMGDLYEIQYPQDEAPSAPESLAGVAPLGMGSLAGSRAPGGAAASGAGAGSLPAHAGASGAAGSAAASSGRLIAGPPA